MNIRATHDALLVFAGYAQSRDFILARRRYRGWRRDHKEERVRIAWACQRGEIKATTAMKLLNLTMPGNEL